MVDVIISSIVVSLWLAGCLAKSTLIGWREYYGGGGVGVDRHLCGAQQTRGFDPMLFHYWPTANGAGPTLKQHRVKASCLLGELSHYDTRGPSVSGSVSGWNRQCTVLCVISHMTQYLINIKFKMVHLTLTINNFTAGFDFRRQNLTSTPDVYSIWRPLCSDTDDAGCVKLSRFLSNGMLSLLIFPWHVDSSHR